MTDLDEDVARNKGGALKDQYRSDHNRTWEIIMGKKLYVGNLSYEVDNVTLERLFTTYGKVESASVITDRYTGRSK